MAFIPPVTKLSSSIIRILGCNPGPMTLQGTNTYLLGTGKRRLLIDTGDADIPDYLKHLGRVLEEEKAMIGAIILTHWHHDHVGGVKDVLRMFADIDCHVYKYPRVNETDVCPEVPAEIKIEKLSDQQEFEVVGSKLQIVHTPGHTTDHVILTTAEGVLFSGDCILGEGTAVFEDLYSYMKSLENILTIKPAIIYPGHGNVIEDPIAKIKYYINHRNHREEQILDLFMKNPQKQMKCMDVVKVIYQETPEKLWPAASLNVGHHLSKLAKEGKLSKILQSNEETYHLNKPSNL
uniref:Beta-lactamase-like protein 2 homolog n=1 Tax=Glossina brevipalpis TaxID=37001 RepID=A0A1A9X4N4_9MUSC